ncbi:MAG TPA: dihydrofolate reductase family protein [Chitinophagaceae bacterium]|nr:dihydrofolate reductase family protein [Chitinophagaceae bacterium]
MRKIVAGFAISLDGYIAGPDNEYDWIIIDKEIDFAVQMKRFDTYFIGRKTYELSKAMGGNPFGKSKVYIFSNTLTEVEKTYQLINGDVKEVVNGIKNEKGKDIAVFGGGELLTSLLNLDLVDEISLAVIPILLGKGIPFVREINKKLPLKLTDSKTYSNGTVQVTYTVNK